MLVGVECLSCLAAEPYLSLWTEFETHTGGRWVSKQIDRFGEGGLNIEVAIWIYIRAFKTTKRKESVLDIIFQRLDIFPLATQAALDVSKETKVFVNEITKNTIYSCIR